MSKNAIILCSGGLDSVVTAHYVKKKLGYEKLIVLFFDYNQKTIEQERRCSRQCAEELGAEFEEVKLDWLGKISGSLINREGEVGVVEKKDLKDTKEEAEKFYVPCRNTVFLVHALALADSLFIKANEVYDLFVGFKCEGEESYPDATKDFVEKMNKLGEIGCATKIEIKAPLHEKDKEDIVLVGKELGVDFKKTFSCYVSEDEKHCGKCLACALRKAGFYWSGVGDVTPYI